MLESRITKVNQVSQRRCWMLTRLVLANNKECRQRTLRRSRQAARNLNGALRGIQTIRGRGETLKERSRVQLLRETPARGKERRKRAQRRPKKITPPMFQRKAVLPIQISELAGRPWAYEGCQRSATTTFKAIEAFLTNTETKTAAARSEWSKHLNLDS